MMSMKINNNNNNGVVYLSSSGEWGYSDVESDVENTSNKRRKTTFDNVLPLGFLDPLSPEERVAMQSHHFNNNINVVYNKCSNGNKEMVVVKEEVGVAVDPLAVAAPAAIRGCKQFWKAGDYETMVAHDNSSSYSVGMDHARVHPKFLHSNATSHKWALGAFAELLDNALDEACNGATYVHVDVLDNEKHKGKMLLVEDNGGGMFPNKMRQCMSLGYSEKSKSANTIGQYGNGFKTSTMRLGADVIVFSRCQGNYGTSSTQSIGLLSYTFLRSTGKQDIIVPMIDYQKSEDTWTMLARSSLDDFKRNLDTIVQWSPYRDEEDLLRQFDFLEAQGTRIIIYNLWEDDTRTRELDFESDLTDIQIKGVNRDDKKIEMARKYPNSRHFLTYRHSLRSYASILYLRIPPNFRIILRKQDVVHHSIVNDMMHSEEITYKPAALPEEPPKDSNIFANVTIGFVKDAMFHIDIQGFNVYHKNRLIKPFWRVWNAAGSSGRGVIGILEANFVEPAHDKQGFEQTVVLSRLQARLVVMQKKFWTQKSHLIGYVKRGVAGETEATPVAREKYSTQPSSDGHVSNANTQKSNQVRQQEPVCFTQKSNPVKQQEPVCFTQKSNPVKLQEPVCFTQKSNPVRQQEPVCFTYDEMVTDKSEARSRYQQPETFPVSADAQKTSPTNQSSDVKTTNNNSNGHYNAVSVKMLAAKLKQEYQLLQQSQQAISCELQVEKERNKLLESQLEVTKKKLEDSDKQQEILVDAVVEERRRRDLDEENMRKKLKEASETIHLLVTKVKQLENRAAAPVGSCKIER